MLGDNVAPIDLLQGRSPTLDLDSMYGGGPNDPESAKFYEADGLHLKVGKTQAAGGFPGKKGFDLLRGAGSNITQKRKAIIPDERNDENLAIAQLHLAMIRFHNRVVDTLDPGIPPANRFGRARQKVVKHYQWMLKTDYLPRICAPGVVSNVFNQGRKVFEVGVPCDGGADDADRVLGGRLPARAFDDPGRVQLERCVRLRDGVSRLPLRVHGQERQLGRQPAARGRLDSRLPPSLRLLGDPGGEAGAGRSGREVQPGDAHRHEARGSRSPPSRASRRTGGEPRAQESQSREDGQARDRPADGGVPEEQGRQRHEADERADPGRQQRCGASRGLNAGAATRCFFQRTPLWFYILREAEFNGGKLKGVGARIVAETFHRAMEGSNHSIVRDKTFKPSLGPNNQTFRMTDLLFFAFQGQKALLNPLGD